MPSNGENATLGATSDTGETQSNVPCDESSLVVKVSIDGSSRGNNNEPLLSSGEFQPGVDLANAAKSEALVDQSSSIVNKEVNNDDTDKTENLFQQDQECTDIFVSGNKKEELGTGNVVLNSINGTNVSREDDSKFHDDVVEGHDRSIIPGSEMEKPSAIEDSSGADSGAETEQTTTLFSHPGNEIIIRDDDNLVTVIQGTFAVVLVKCIRSYECVSISEQLL